MDTTIRILIPALALVLHGTVVSRRAAVSTVPWKDCSCRPTGTMLGGRVSINKIKFEVGLESALAL
jgi:hypothetical protein